MPRGKRGYSYIGIDLPALDLKILKQRAHDDDRSVASLIRIAVSEWISKDPKSQLLKSAIITESARKKKEKES